ncbi:carboxypeptidase-like regulatory domain-containing protein [Ekhidna sp.]
MKIASIAAYLYVILFFIGTPNAVSQDAKTKLLVTVIDGSGSNVSEADIIIYSSEEDYLNRENRLIKGKTDKKGRFQFKGLQAGSYYLEVKKDSKNNNNENPETGLLSPNKVNRVIVVIK